jgi:hypothetical protein
MGASPCQRKSVFFRLLPILPEKDYTAVLEGQGPGKDKIIDQLIEVSIENILFLISTSEGVSRR